MKCKVCEEQEYQTKTMDGQPICKQCFDVVHEELFDGIPTLQDAVTCMQWLKDYDNERNNYILSWRKWAALQNINEYDLMDELRRKENEVSVDELRKTRNCLHKKEHVGIMRKVLLHYGVPLISTPLADNGGQKIFLLRNRYTALCPYLT